MNHLYKKLLLIAACISPATTYADCGSTSRATPYFNLRSTSWNVVRDMVGWEHLINRCDQDCWYGAAAITLEYDQTFRPNRITQALFGPDVSTISSSPASCSSEYASVITIAGSVVPNRGPNDWLADYFGLPITFLSNISFAPRIQNFTTDLSFYWGFDNWVNGLYVRLDLPITHTRWNLNAQEKVLNSFRPIGSTQTGSYPAGYFSPNLILSQNLLPQATDFFGGCKAPTFPTDTVNDITVVFDPLTASRWAPCDAACTRLTRLAAAIAVVGWNFVCCDDYHVGLNIRGAAPTGNRPAGIYLFEPIVGNGHHWELGAGLSAHTNLWRCDDTNQEINLYFEGNVTHLFKTCQTRTFDLCNKPNSRYMLAERLVPQTNGLGGTDVADPTLADVTLSDFQFANEFAPVANLTRQQVNVSIAAQGDLAVKLEYVTNCGFIWDVGYNLWARSCEKIQRICGAATDPLVAGQTWALKGDASVYGFINPRAGTVVALAATENCADIHGGTNRLAAARSGTTTLQNPGIDNAALAVQVIGSTITPLITVETDPVNTSIQPITLTKDLVDVSGTSSFSNKLFTHLTFEWGTFERCTPFLGAGASVEFGANDTCNPVSIRNDTCTRPCNTIVSCQPSCNSCHMVSVSQWGAWVKGGVAY